MLDLDAQSLWEEATEAIEYQKRRTSAIDEMINSYRTPWHVGSADKDAFTGMTKFDSRNHAFEFIALTIAQTVFDNPKWQVTADRGYAADMEAPALQAGLNKWTRDQRLRKTLTRLYVDYCFHSCTSIVYLDGTAPKLRRIGIRRAFRDHRCFDPEDMRYQGHVYIRDKKDLMEDEEWDPAVVEKMAEGAGLKDVREFEDRPQVKDRGEVALIDMWVPEAPVEGVREKENYHGMIYTLPLVGFDGTDKVPKFPRKPRAAYCSSHGMYQYGGTYPVPDDIIPLSQLIAVNGQNRQNNEVARALYEAIVEYKKIIFTSGKDPTLTGKVRRARHGNVLTTGLQDVARMIAQIELGGPTPALLTGAQVSQETLDRASGISDAMRGNVTGGATAYENSVAAAGATARQAYPKQQFVDFLGEIGFAAAWLMHTSDDVKIDLPGGMGQMLGGPPSAHAMAIHKQLGQHGVPDDVIEKYIEWSDKQHRNTPFETFGFNVEPLSTERASDPANRARMMTVIPMAMQLAQAAVTMPQLNVKEMLGWLGQAFDMPDLPRVFDEQAAAQLGAIQMQAGIEQPQTNMSAGTPRMSADIAPRPPGPGNPGFKGPGPDVEKRATKNDGKAGLGLTKRKAG